MLVLACLPCATVTVWRMLVLSGVPDNARGAGVIVDEYAELMRNRILWLGEQVDDEICNRLSSRLIMLEALDPLKPVWLYINSPGGSITAGMALYDTMQMVSMPVYTVGLGECASMGQFLLSSGAPGYRFIAPHTRVLMHQPSGGIGGSVTEVESNIKLINEMKQEMAEITAKQTGQTVETILRDNEYDHWFTAREAVEYGFADHIVDSNTSLAGYAQQLTAKNKKNDGKSTAGGAGEKTTGAGSTAGRKRAASTRSRSKRSATTERTTEPAGEQD